MSESQSIIPISNKVIQQEPQVPLIRHDYRDVKATAGTPPEWCRKMMSSLKAEASAGLICRRFNQRSKFIIPTASDGETTIAKPGMCLETIVGGLGDTKMQVLHTSRAYAASDRPP